MYGHNVDSRALLTAVVSYFLVVFVVACLHFGALHLVTKRQHVLALGQSNLWSRVHLISYTGLAGIMGGQSVLCAKSCAELAKSVARGENCFKSAGTYLIFLGLLLFLCAQVFSQRQINQSTSSTIGSLPERSIAQF